MITMSARKLCIWSLLIILCIFITARNFENISLVTDYIELAASLLLILSLTIASWRLKKRVRRRMEAGLGRKIDDAELTSIKRWMEIPEQAIRAGRDVERFDFND